mmetsp:Transcript_59903/g.128534  ORF Transcript_59903/g.128534 Transcript_59903/m.128534 type:complete len:510 (+) Transcript_59903:100-1629(+)
MRRAGSGDLQWILWTLVFLLLGPLSALALRHQGRLQRSGASAGRVVEPWQSCGIEGELIAGQGRVRFGWGLSWVEAELPRTAARCAAETFRGLDPAPSIRKVCQCAASISGGDGGDLVEELGTKWRRCAEEGSVCACPTGAVRFGTGSRWVSATPGEAAGQLLCNAASFQGADPSAGEDKECWCEQRHAQPEQGRVAIVLLSRHPADMRRWLWYHLDYMGVEHVFMQVEDTPEFNGTWAALPVAHRQAVTVWRAAPDILQGGEQRPADDYETLQKRQLRAMRRAKTAATALGIEWLVHIDDDELLYTPMHRPVGEVLASLPHGVDQAYIPNTEAVYTSPEVVSCFSQTTQANVNRYTFASYANGKSALRIAATGAVPAGPHMWRTADGLELPSAHLDSEPFGPPLLVIHFESCPFARWEDKFWELGNTSPRKVAAIPFGFYRESIRRMQRCRSRSGQRAPDKGPCTEAALRRFWAGWKTEANPALREQDLLPIQIPWPGQPSEGLPSEA